MTAYWTLWWEISWDNLDRMEVIPPSSRFSIRRNSGQPRRIYDLFRWAARGLEHSFKRQVGDLEVAHPDDSGAKKFGVLEKNAVLSVGKLVRDKLMATGRYRVLMTRDTDRFVTLGNRRRFAEKHRADLFISVHADYARRSE